VDFGVCCARILCYSSLGHDVASWFGDILPATKVAASKVAKESLVRYMMIMGRLTNSTMFLISNGQEELGQRFYICALE
jgi:hypothetical protein